MAAISTTRGLPFDPKAADAMRKLALEHAEAERKEDLRAHGRKLDQEAREAKRAAIEAHREEMRAHGRMLDEQARQRRREQKQEIDRCYRERFTDADAA